MKKWTEQKDWGNSMIHAFKCAGFTSITLFQYPKSDDNYGFYLEADGYSNWIGYTKKSVYDFCKNIMNRNEWLGIVRLYREKYELKMSWHEYLMEFYYPPTRIK